MFQYEKIALVFFVEAPFIRTRLILNYFEKKFMMLFVQVRFILLQFLCLPRVRFCYQILIVSG